MLSVREQEVIDRLATLDYDVSEGYLNFHRGCLSAYRDLLHIDYEDVE